MTKEFDSDQAPVPVDPAQWPESRGFVRIYTHDPDRQARLVKALLGFRQDLREWQHDGDTVAAVEVVLRAFHKRFPEFMIDGYERDPETEWGSGAYNADDRMVRQMEEIIDPPEPNS